MDRQIQNPFQWSLEDIKRQLLYKLAEEGKNASWLHGLQFGLNKKTLSVSFIHAYFASWFKFHERGWLDEAIKKLFPELSCQYQFPAGFRSALKNSSSEKTKQRKSRPTKLAEETPTAPFASFFCSEKNAPVLEALEKTVSEDNIFPSAILLHGKSGTGKTMLLNLLAAGLARRGKNVLFQNALEFCKKFNSGFYDNFWMGYDALLLDDVQRIAQAANSMDALELCCDRSFSFNEKKLTVFALSSPDDPKLEIFSPRLRNRLAGMLQLELTEPDFSTRLRFVEHFSKTEKLKLSRAQILLLARQGTAFPVLKGMLSRIKFFRDASMELPENLDPENLTEREKANPPQWKTIVEHVARHFHLKPENLLGNSRKADQVLARQLAMYLCRRQLGFSFKEIGALFGGKDHSTVMHGIKKIQQLQTTDKDMHRFVQELENS